VPVEVVAGVLAAVCVAEHEVVSCSVWSHSLRHRTESYGLICRPPIRSPFHGHLYSCSEDAPRQWVVSAIA
jgi:hypothetical protein